MSNPLLVCVTREREALGLQLSKVVVHSIQLLLHACTVGGGLGDGLVKANEFLSLVLNVLILRGLGDLVLLGLLVILTCSGGLCGSHLSQTFREVRLDYLKKPDDASACALS